MELLVQFPTVNKNDTIEENDKAIAAANRGPRRAVVRRVLAVSAQEFDSLGQQLLTDCLLWAGMGGPTTTQDGSQACEIAVLTAPGREPLAINPEGHGYARYVGRIASVPPSTCETVTSGWVAPAPVATGALHCAQRGQEAAPTTHNQHSAMTTAAATAAAAASEAKELPTWLTEAQARIAAGEGKAAVAAEYGVTRRAMRALLKEAGLYEKPVASASRAERRAARKQRAAAAAAPAAVAPAPAALVAAAVEAPVAPAAAGGNPAIDSRRADLEALTTLEVRAVARRAKLTKIDGRPVGSCGNGPIIDAILDAFTTFA